MTRDLEARGTCIEIHADDVTVEGNGHTITFGTEEAGYGIRSRSKRTVVEDVTLRGGEGGVPPGKPGYVAIYTRGFGARVHHNRIDIVNGHYAYGILAGEGADVYENQVSLRGVARDAILNYAISTKGAGGTSIRRNWVRTVNAHGIYPGSSSTIGDNCIEVTKATDGYVNCIYAWDACSCIVRENVVVGQDQEGTHDLMGIVVHLGDSSDGRHLIEQNTIYLHGAAGSHGRGIYGLGFENVIRHNSVRVDCDNGNAMRVRGTVNVSVEGNALQGPNGGLQIGSSWAPIVNSVFRDNYIEGRKAGIFWYENPRTWEGVRAEGNIVTGADRHFLRLPEHVAQCFTRDARAVGALTETPSKGPFRVELRLSGNPVPGTVILVDARGRIVSVHTTGQDGFVRWDSLPIVARIGSTSLALEPYRVRAFSGLHSADTSVQVTKNDRVRLDLD